MPSSSMLLTGASGYVGGLLLPLLEARDHRVRCLVRRADRLRGRVGPSTEVIQGDSLDAVALASALAGVDVAFYLIHSMGGHGSFEETDREAARRFGEAARSAGVRRIVYLGGLGDARDSLSPHLRSRRETGDALRASGVPVTELRASVVIGAGSLSFEMARALVERLPVMICPKWVAVKAQPVAVADVLSYLVAAAEDAETTGNLVCEIGGPDIVSYGGIMREYARQRGLTRRLIPVPLLTPRLSSLWLGLVTPLYANVGRWLIDGMRNETVVIDAEPARRYPIQPRGLRQAVAEAIEQRAERVEALLADAAGPHASAALEALRSSGCLLDHREAEVHASAARAFAPVRSIGGANGYYFAGPLWRLRAWCDRVVGGIGMRAGRRDPDTCMVGDAVDFWRVVAFDADRRLTLRAEMAMPGRAWLQFAVLPTAGSEAARLRQTALFDPRGLLGVFYWVALLPAHAVIFRGMLRAIAARGTHHTTGSGR
jgi:uncharacterized protein YbjT (DUF2867 family)